MKIIVCTKQVPSIEETRFDPVTKTLIREGVPNDINAFDRRALGQAIAMREQLGGEVVAVTMGPPQAEEVLRHCLAAGADRALHLCDRAFAGADTLATSRALAAALRREGFDLIFCGKYSVDAETGQVGPELAELLGIPHVSGATKVEVLDGSTGSPRAVRLRVERETDEGFDTVEVTLPALLTASERLTRPPQVSDEMIAQVKGVPIPMITAADLGLDAEQVGLKGSPTWVQEIYSVKPERHPIIIQGGDPARASEELVQHLLGRGLFGAWTGSAPQTTASRTNGARATDKSIWVAVELVAGQVRGVSLELLGGAGAIAADLGGEVAAVLIGGPGAERHVAQLTAHGADRVYLAESPALEEFDSVTYSHVLSRAIEQYKPWAVLVPATTNGRDFAPRVAARLGLGLTGDAVGLELSTDGLLRQLKPAFGGTIVAPILSKTFPQMATMRPGMLEVAPADSSRKAEIMRLSTDKLPQPGVTMIFHDNQAGTAGVALENAEIVVCVGYGLGGPANLPYAQRLADTLGGAIGATRRVVDSGWLPRQVQVGLTGKALAPKLYIGLGVRGAFNHIIGIQRAGTVVVINNDPDALMIQLSDYAVIGDYKEIVPPLIEALERAKQ